jgi:hypothetical protein
MKERTHESPGQDFYAELQESIWNELEEDVEVQAPQEHSDENLKYDAELQVYRDENESLYQPAFSDAMCMHRLAGVAANLASASDQLQADSSESISSNLALQENNGEEPKQDFYGERQEPNLDGLEEDAEAQQYCDERLHLGERLKAHIHESLNLKRSIAYIKDRLAARSIDKKTGKAHKLVTRLDKVFLLMLLVMGIIYISQASSNSQAKTPVGQGHTSPVNTSSHVGGMGGIDAPVRSANPQAQDPYQGFLQGVIASVQGALGTTLPFQIPATNDWLTGNLNPDGTYISGGTAFQTDMGLTSDNGGVDSLLKGVEGIVGSILVIAFSIAGYKILGGSIGFRYADALETLPRTILAVIAALLSLTFVDFVIQLNNGLCNVMLSFVPQASRVVTVFVVPSQNWLIYLVGFILANVAMIIAALIIALPGVGTLFGAAVAGILGTAGALVYLLSFRWAIVAILSIMLAVQLAMRMILIDIFVVLSPLAIVCWAFPIRSLQEIARAWCMGFLKTVFVQFVQVTCICIGMMTIPSPNLSNIGQIFTGTNLMGFIGPVAILWLTVRMPRIIGSSALGTAEAAGHAIGRAVSGGVVN